MDVNGTAGAATGPDFTQWADLTEKLQEAFVVGEILRDEAGNAVDWRYVAVNAAWETLHDTPRESAIGRTMRDVNPGIGPAWVTLFAGVAETGQPATFTRPLRHRWYDGRAYPLGGPFFMVLFTDSTASRRATDQAAQLTALVEQSTDLIGVADTSENVLFINPAGLAMLGLPDMQAAASIKVRDYFVPEERETTPVAAAAAALAQGGWEGEARMRHFVTGETIPVLHSVFPLRDAAGKVTAIGTVTRDLRARLRGEARRSALLELGDRLRDMADPEEMSLAAAGILLRTLNASRAAYGTVDPAPETVLIGQDCTAEGVASLRGSYRFRDFGSYIEQLKRNELVAFADTQTDPRAVAAAWQAVGARAAINLPIFERGHFVAVVLVHQTTPRNWSPEEIAFIRNVADRTRAAIQRRRAELQLQELAASLEREVAHRTADRNLLWQLSTDIMAVTDFLGVVQSVNPAWTAVLGWAEADLIGRSLVELIHPDDVEPSTQAVLRMTGGEAVRRFENRYRHRDGTYRWISWTAVPGGGVISAVGRDVTDERARAQALELSESRLRSVFETSYLFQGLLTPEGIVLDANKASLAGIGVPLQDVVGQPFWHTPWFTGTPGLPALIEAAVPVVAAGATVRRELTAELPTGRRVFDMTMHPVRNSAGAVIAILPEAADVTEQRDAESQLRQAQKMEAVGQLTGGLAHDFNNLITGITGNLELLQVRARHGDTTELERFVEAAQGAARRAAALTHRLLAFSRQQTLDPRPTDVSLLVAGMEEMIRRTMGPDVDVEVVAEAGLWRTMVDQHQLENALLNLCINARQAMPAGGKLTIESCNKELDSLAARERDLQPGQYVTLCVSDTGTGMSPEVMARAFDPFFTTKPIGEGTGLGLSMIYGFVRQSGGQARIYSEPGQGALVCLYLPRTAAADEEKDVPQPTAPLAPPPLARSPLARPPLAPPLAQLAGRGETVLVVDDEPTIRMLVTEVLQDLGYETLAAADGPAALDILRHDRKIDLLISDVGLPGGMNGRELAEAGLALRPELLVLFITGYAEHAVLSHGHLKPGMHVLTKPFNIEALARRVREIVGR